MNRKIQKMQLIFFLILLFFLSACSDEKKNEKLEAKGSTQQAVTKKIEKKIDNTPTDKDISSTAQIKPTIDSEKKESSAVEKVLEETEIVIDSNKKDDYDPTGKINPFMPFLSDDTEKTSASMESEQKKKREPLTPLEKIDIAQLKLTAVTRTPTGNIALVEEASGKGYIISEGTYIGLNSGKVISVLSDKVIIEEEIENIFGKVSIQERELKLQKPTGE